MLTRNGEPERVLRCENMLPGIIPYVANLEHSQNLILFTNASIQSQILPKRCSLNVMKASSETRQRSCPLEAMAHMFA